MSIAEFSPIVIFAYNRCEYLKCMLSALENCIGFEQSPIIIYVDGPKGDRDVHDVENVKTFIRSLKYKNLVRYVFREENFGLKRSIYGGVSDVCKEFGRVIVLEDDIILSQVALEYFNKSLDKYENNPRVWSVVAYQYSVPRLCGHKDALMLPFTYPWGWATWERAWSQYDMYAEVDDRDLSSKSFRQAFDVFGIRDFRNMIVLALSDVVSCWFSPWYYKIFSQGGVSIFPPQSYVKNIGIRKGGTHSSCLNPYQLLVNPAPVLQSLCNLPDEIKVDYWAIDLIRSSWDARVQKYISHLGRIKRYLLRFLRGIIK